MIIKKFQAKTEAEAINMAKEELGKDAIVMNIKNIKPQGIYKLFRKPKVEVTAAVDENISYSGEKVFDKIQQIKDQTRLNPSPVSVIKEPEEPIEENRITKQDEEISVIEEKLNNLQQMLINQINNKQVPGQIINSEEKKKEEEQKTNPCYQLIYNQLVNNDVEKEYAKQIVNEVEKNLSKEASIDQVLAGVYQKIILKLGQPKQIKLNPKTTKIVYFIGPTGVGKTTTIAKIASEFKVNQNKKVALVTLDTYRIAAIEQLRTYGDILGIPLKVVYTDTEIKEAADTFSDFDILLIDTAGRSHKSNKQKEDIGKYINIIPEEQREVYLVLSATTKYHDLINITQEYAKLTDFNLIFTKLDETDSFGSILNIRLSTGAALSYSTWGQNVPDDVGQINTQKIAKQLLGGNN